MRAEGLGGFEGTEGFEDEVAAYAAEVRAQLADLPADDSAELLEDLEDHLREVAAEDAGTLRERLGEPATYARELRQAAGLPAPGEMPRRSASRSSSWEMLRRSALNAGRRVERRIRATDVGRVVLDFLPSLVPAWWIFRAWVLVRALEVWTGYVHIWNQYSLIPKVHDSRLMGFVALLVAIPASVYVGRRGMPPGWQRRVVQVGEGALAVFAFGIVVAGLANENQDSAGNPYQVGYVQHYESGLNENGKPITNLWVYDKDGKRLDGVYIFDEDGQPVSATPPGSSYGGDIDSGAWVDGDGQMVTNRYPRQVLRPQYDLSNSPHYTPLPPPPVNPPKGVHQASDPQAAPSTAATSSAPSSSATPQGSATPADPAATGTPSASNLTPATPGSTG